MKLRVLTVFYGVLVHSGFSCNSGHYYSYCKNSNGKWFQFNDSDVRQTSLNNVLAQDEAYLLFYNKLTHDLTNSNTVKQYVAPEPEVKKQQQQTPSSPVTSTTRPMFPLKAKIEAEQQQRKREQEEKLKKDEESAAKKQEAPASERFIKR